MTSPSRRSRRSVIIGHRVRERVGAVETRIRRIRETAISSSDVSVPSVTSATTWRSGSSVPSESLSTPSPVSSDDHVPSGRSVLISGVIVVRGDRRVVDVGHRQTSPWPYSSRPVIIGHRIRERVRPVETRIRGIRETTIGVQRQASIVTSAPQWHSGPTSHPNRVDTITRVISDHVARWPECPHRWCNRYPSPPADHSHQSPSTSPSRVRDRTVIIRHRIGETVSAVETRIRGIGETDHRVQRQASVRDVRNHGGVRASVPSESESTPSPVSSVTTFPVAAVSSSVV